MKKILLLTVVGAAGGLLAAMVATVFIPDLSLGNTLGTAGRTEIDKFIFYDKPYGYIGHILLGLLVCGSVALFATMKRDLVAKFRSAGIAGIAGAAFCIGSLTLTDSIKLNLASRISDDGKVNLIELVTVSTVPDLLWFCLVSFSLAFAIFLGVGPSRFLLGRVWISTLIAIALSYIISNLMFLFILPSLLMDVMTTRSIESLNISSHIRPIIWGQLLGMGAGAAMAFGIAQNVWKPAWLKAFRGSAEGRLFELSGQISRIGCQEGVEVYLPADGTVAPIHAQVQCEDESHYVVDIAGGMTVNGQPVQTQWLNDGDKIGVGSAMFIYRTRLRGKKKGEEVPQAVAMSPVPMQMPVLIDAMGHEHILHPGVNIVGREIGCDVALTWENGISRKHAEIIVDQHGVTVRDLGSTNGTSMNGDLLQSPTALSPGQTVMFGKVACTLKQDRPV